MKKLLIGLTFLFCLSALAEHDISKHKQEMLQNIEAKIAELQNAKNCISSAQDRAALKACHQAMAQARKDHHEKMKERREERVDEKIKQLQEKKEQMRQGK